LQYNSATIVCEEVATPRIFEVEYDDDTSKNQIIQLLKNQIFMHESSVTEDINVCEGERIVALASELALDSQVCY
jgi:hypothetical protein